MKVFLNSLLLILACIQTQMTLGQNIGAHVNTPEHPLHVTQPDTATLGSNQPVAKIQYTGTNSHHVIALQAQSSPVDGFGIGGDFRGGHIGVRYSINPTGSGNYYGLSGSVQGGSGTNYGANITVMNTGTAYGLNTSATGNLTTYGVNASAQGAGTKFGTRAQSSGTGTNYGLYAAASGGSANWAGYFDQGDVYIRNRLAVGHTQPFNTVHIQQTAGIILGDRVSVLRTEYTGTNEADAVAIYGSSAPQSGYGIGGLFSGGSVGVIGESLSPGSNYSRTGVRGKAQSNSVNFGIFGDASGTHLNYGLYGFATGGQTNYGIYASAPGNGTNWAGFFADGNVHIKNRLGIGTTNPLHALDIQSDEGIVRILATNNSNGSGLELRNNTVGAPYLGSIDFVTATGITAAEIKATKTKDLVFRVGSVDRLSINDQGQVAIPTGLDASYSDDGLLRLGFTSTANVIFDNNEILARHNGAPSALWLQRDGGNLILAELQEGKVGIGRVPTTNILEVQGIASKNSAGDWVANSDARLKKNIQPLDSDMMLRKLLSLKGINYEWSDDETGSSRPEGIQYGFTAQNIQEVFPTLVEEDAQGYLQTAYGTYDAMVVEAMRALYEKILDVQNENAALNAEIVLIKDMITGRLDQQEVTN